VYFQRSLFVIDEIEVRNPKRIGRITDIILKIWIQMPGMRLGQLLYNAIGELRPPELIDVFYVEDDLLEEGLQSFAKRAGIPIEDR